MRFLTDPGDTVLDIFAGSNTAGAVAEGEGRRWLAFEERLDYLAASVFRFVPKDAGETRLREAYERFAAGDSVYVTPYVPQTEMFEAAE